MKSENLPMEIERKFLIRKPSEEILRSIPSAELTEIVQIYLKLDNSGYNRRIRKRGTEGNWQYTYTRKKKIRFGERIELEDEISEKTFQQLIQEADPKRQIVRKIRCCVPYLEQLLEIDIYDFSDVYATVEIELSDIHTPVHLPEWLSVLEDVTDKPGYSNFELSEKLSFPEEQTKKFVYEMKIPDGPEIISKEMFREYSRVEKIEIPPSVQEIADNAFSDCVCLKELVIPQTVKKIGKQICSNCMKLESFSMLAPVKFTPDWLKGCFNLKNIVLSAESGAVVRDYAVYTPDLSELLYVPPALKKLVLPEQTRTARIFGNLSRLVFYPHQKIILETDTVSLFEFVTPDKTYPVFCPKFRKIPQYSRWYLLNDMILTLQTGAFPESFSHIMKCFFWDKSVLELWTEFSETICKIYKKDFPALFLEQLAEWKKESSACGRDSQFQKAMIGMLPRHMYLLPYLENETELKEKLFLYLVENRPLSYFQNILDNYCFSQEIIQELYITANQCRKYELQVFLMQFLHDHFGETDIFEKLKL